MKTEINNNIIINTLLDTHTNTRFKLNSKIIYVYIKTYKQIVKFRVSVIYLVLLSREKEIHLRRANQISNEELNSTDQPQ